MDVLLVLLEMDHHHHRVLVVVYLDLVDLHRLVLEVDRRVRIIIRMDLDMVDLMVVVEEEEHLEEEDMVVETVMGRGLEKKKITVKVNFETMI